MGQAATHLNSMAPNWFKDSVHKVNVEIQRDLSLVKKEILLAKDVALIDYESFRETISNLNTILKSCCNGSNEKVLFGIRIIDDADLGFWKTTVRIICFKVNLTNKTVCIKRFMNLHQFWRLRDELIREINYKRIWDEQTHGFEFVPENISQYDGTEGDQEEHLDIPCSLTVSSVLERVDQCSSNDDPVENDCSICMDRKCDISLPCAHSFCGKCIGQWSIENQTCPVCRDQINTEEEFWEFAEMPKRKDLERHLISLASGDT